MYCARCGYVPIGDDHGRCPKCGLKLIDPVEQLNLPYLYGPADVREYVPRLTVAPKVHPTTYP